MKEGTKKKRGRRGESILNHQTCFSSASCLPYYSRLKRGYGGGGGEGKKITNVEFTIMLFPLNSDLPYLEKR